MKHNKLNAMVQKRRLNDPKNLVSHRESMIISQNKRLADPEKRVKRNELLKVIQKKRLAVPEEHVKHNELLKVTQKKRLAVPEEREKHRKRLILAQNQRLMDLKMRKRHNQINSCAQKRRWKKHLQTISDHRCRTKSRISSFKINCLTKKEKQRMSLIRVRRSNIKKISSLRSTLLVSYKNIIKMGPSYTCSCCGRLCFQHSIRFFAKNNKLSETGVSRFRDSLCKPEVTEGFGVEGICGTCDGYIKKMKIPPLSLAAHRDLQFPIVPNSVRNLTTLEERFVCPRIPFMQIRASKIDQQYLIQGRVVNVPTDVVNNVKILPRTFNETAVIPIALKKRKQYKSIIKEEPIRPHAIAQALEALNNCPAFVEADVSIDAERIPVLWHLNISGENESHENHDKNYLDYDSDFEEDDPEPVNVPAETTMLISNHNPDALVFTPGEGFTPLPLFLDIHAEALSFIRIYGGELRPKPNHISYQKLVNSELLRYDRRCASEPSKLFYCATKLRGMKISASILLCLKKLKGKQQHPTAEFCLSEDLIKSFHIHDSGYRLFLPDRGSPAFWGQKQSEIFAMIRQIGPPTLFVTLSPAETQWPELLVILKKVIDNEIITEDAAFALSYQEKVRLISSDPVSCARYFDFRIKQMIKLFTTKRYGIFFEHEVVDYYYRVEFQQRGSPHIHSLLWLRNSPNFDVSNDVSIRNCEQFIDKFISCSSSNLSDTTVAFQTHKHTFTCKKKHPKTKESYCRFGIPFFPMAKTKILTPLSKGEVNDERKKELYQTMKNVKDYLKEMYKKINNDNYDNSFDRFLNHLHLSNDEYVLSIRSSLKRPTVFLKRHPNDIKINAYNLDILNLHQANMDIQFITDTYSVAVYVLNYINKTKRGISNVLRQANEEIAQGELSIKEKLKFMANKFLDSSEFSAQEAVYYVLPLPLSQCTRSVEFINTGPPDKRVSILLSKTELQKLPKSSTNVFAKSNIDHYVNRPDSLIDLCLADFVAWYTYKKNIASSKCTNIETNDDQSDTNSEVDEEERKCTNTLKLKNNDGFISKRTKPKIIRFVRFNIETHEDDFYREQLMLFLPWVDEESELICVDHITKFNLNKHIVLHNRKPYIFPTPNEDETVDFIDEALREHKDENGISKDDIDEIHDPPNSGDGYEVLRDRTNEGDVFYDGGFVIGNEKIEDDFVPVPRILPEERYLEVVRSLNDKQQRYHYHVLHTLKTNAGPIYECVLGSAGVGKSRLIEALEQSLVRFYNSTAGVNIESLRVLLCAPTGKAAFNIRGVTLHSIFALPLNQASYEMPPLNSSVSNTLFCKLKDVKLIIMDEVSMIGTKMFARVDTRLKQIFRSHLPFAGKSVILFGDFNQLAPVGDSYIFSSNKANPYSNLMGNPLWDMFKFYKLTEIMRQKDDVQFAAALNNLAMGILTPEEILMFESRQRTHVIPDSKALRLFRTNDEVDTYNRTVFRSKVNSEIRQFEAIDRVLGNISEEQRISTLDYVKKSMKTANTYGLPTYIQLCVGIRYMVTVNVKTPDGLVNGAVGILKFIESQCGNRIVRLWLLFDDEKVGRETRRGSQAATKRLGIDSMLTPLDLVNRNIRPRPNSPIMVMRRQFPVVPAEAITIYKSQGGTYDSVVVTLRKGMRRNEMYVAFSRSTSLRGLTILGKFKPPAPVDSNNLVVREIEKGLKEKPVNMSLHFLQDHPDLFSIIFHNVTSLRKHILDIKNDRCFTSAKLILIVETWLKPHETVDLPGYKVIYRSDVKQPCSHAYGMIIYSKTDMANQFEISFDFNEEKKGLACNIAVIRTQTTFICAIYKPPSTPSRVLISRLEEALSCVRKPQDTILIIGDFNEDSLNPEKGHQLHHFFEARGLQNLLPCEPSTNLLTQIDLCFSNNVNVLATYYESYFSYHKPILCVEGLEKNRHPMKSINEKCGKDDEATGKGNQPSMNGELRMMSKTNDENKDDEKCNISLNENERREMEGKTTMPILIHDSPCDDENERHHTARKHLLKEIEDNILPNDSWIYDRALDELLKIIRNTTDFGTLDTLMIQCPHFVTPAINDKDIIILGGLSSTNHWRCAFYNGNQLKIYDTLNEPLRLSREENILINKRYPNLSKKDLIFEKCQKQPDFNSCGVFSAANAVSLSLGLNPSNVEYKLDAVTPSGKLQTTAMRRNFLRIIKEQRLIPFELTSSLN